MSLIVFFHRLTNCNYISFPHVPCLLAQQKIPVKSPCGLFPRTSPVRSVFWGLAPGFHSLSHYRNAHSQALHRWCHCQTKRAQQWPGSHRWECPLKVSSNPGQKHFLSPPLYKSLCLQKICCYFKKKKSPGWVAQLVGASFQTPKGCRFDSQSGYIPRLWVQSLVGAHRGGN